MPLDCELKVEKTDLIYQESPSCLMTLKNAGSARVAIPRPNINPLMPTLRLVEVKTGLEILRHAAIREGDEQRREVFIALEPGGSTQVPFRLLQAVGDLLPGQYDVSAVCDPVAAGRAESKPIRLSVATATPKGLTLASVQGGVSYALYGAWVNVESDPPMIVRGRFIVATEGGVEGVFPVAKASLRARPVLSAPPNGQPVNSQWIAWLQDGTFWAVHFDERLGPSEPRKVGLNAPDAEIVAPLHTEVPEDTTERAEGAALVVLSDRDATRWQLQTFALSARKIAAADAVAMPGPRPKWVLSHEKSDGTRLLAYAQQVGGNCGLYLTPWPARGGPAQPPRKLTDWPGEFVAASAALDRDDALHGGALVWTGKGASLNLELISWALEGGEFKELSRSPAPWDSTTKVGQAEIRINGRGTPSVLIKDEQGSWFLCDGHERHPLPGALAKALLPVDLAFLGGDTRPALIFGEAGRGFRITMSDGSPLPVKIRD